MDKELIKKEKKTKLEVIVAIAQVAMLVSTAIVTFYQINELIKDRK